MVLNAVALVVDTVLSQAILFRRNNDTVFVGVLNGFYTGLRNHVTVSRGVDGGERMYRGHGMSIQGTLAGFGDNQNL